LNNLIIVVQPLPAPSIDPACKQSRHADRLSQKLTNKG
jgi:hypothetical protein